MLCDQLLYVPAALTSREVYATRKPFFSKSLSVRTFCHSTRNEARTDGWVLRILCPFPNLPSIAHQHLRVEEGTCSLLCCCCCLRCCSHNHNPPAVSRKLLFDQDDPSLSPPHPIPVNPVFPGGTVQTTALLVKNPCIAAQQMEVQMLADLGQPSVISSPL